MTAVILLILRIALAVILYAFVAFAVITIWRELRLHGKLLENRRIPSLTLLLSEGGENLERVFAIPELVIGRDQTCEYPISDETVSARHAILRYHHNQWWAEDLQSTNGTFLNDEPLTTPTVIISGDELRCGAARIALHVDLAQSAGLVSH